MPGHKEVTLEQVRVALADGSITKADLKTLMDGKTPTSIPEHPHEAAKVVNVIDVLFFLAGLVLYAALATAAAEASALPWLSSTLLIIPGLLLWWATYKVANRYAPSETIKGLTNALLLTGSLAVITGGMWAAYQLNSSLHASSWAYITAVALVVVGGLHLLFDRFYRRPLLVAFGFYLIVAAFPLAVSGALTGVENHIVDIWALVGIATGALLGYAGTIVARTAPGRAYLKGAFIPVGGILVLGSAYGASQTSDVAMVWNVILPLLIYSAYFFSIKRRSQYFLVTGSLFLALYLITTSIKYFAGLGLSFCLLASGIILLVTAYLAISINKRYIHL